ncbi:MAG: hypothetical protein HY670_09455 [Chloroflexi bacterium]|nr:hypothetical protein [Chloroflexota bacterium]
MSRGSRVRSLLGRELPAVLVAIIIGLVVSWTLWLPTRFALAAIVAVLAYLLYRYLWANEEADSPDQYRYSFNWNMVFVAGYVLAVAFIVLVPASDALFEPDWRQISIASYLRVISALFLIYFLPGYIIVYFIDRQKQLPGAMTLVFSFIVSYFLSTAALFILAVTIRNFDGFLPAYLGISLLLAVPFVTVELRRSSLRLTERQGHASGLPPANFNYSQAILLTLALLVLAGIVLINFKYQNVLRGDMYSHFGIAMNYFREGWYEWWGQQSYPYWFHLNMVAYLRIAGFPMVNAVMLLNFLMVLIIPAFYALGMALFKNRKLATLSTSIFVLFSGVAFVFVIQKKLAALPIDDMGQWWQVLQGVRPATLFREHQFFVEWVFKPRVFGLIDFVAMLFLLRANISARLKVILGAITFAIAYLVHMYEMLIFLTVIAAALVVYVGNTKGISWTACAALVGSLMVLLVDETSPARTYSGLLLWLSIGVSLFMTLLAYLLNTRGTKRLMERLSWLDLSRVIYSYPRIALLYVSWGLFFLAIAAYRFTYPFDSDDLYWSAGVFPWFFWPVKYGVPLVLALVSVSLVLRAGRIERLVAFLALSFVILVILGRLLGVVNIEFYGTPIVKMGATARATPIEEFRFIFLSFVFIALLGAWALLFIVRRIRGLIRNTSMAQYALTGFLVLVLVFSSVDSLLQIEREAVSTENRWQGSAQDIEAVDFLKSNNSATYKVATFSVANSQKLQLSGQRALGAQTQSIRLFNVKRDLFFKNKDMLQVVYSLPSYGVKYIPLTKTEIEEIRKLGEGSWFNKNLFPLLPIAFTNAEHTIYEVPPMSRPVAQPEVALAVPWVASGRETRLSGQRLPLSSEGTNVFSALMLSSARTNYGVFAGGDPAQFNAPVIVLPYDPLSRAGADNWQLLTRPITEERIGPEQADDIRKWVIGSGKLETTILPGRQGPSLLATSTTQFAQAYAALQGFVKGQAEFWLRLPAQNQIVLPVNASDKTSPEVYGWQLLTRPVSALRIGPEQADDVRKWVIGSGNLEVITLPGRQRPSLLVASTTGFAQAYTAFEGYAKGQAEFWMRIPTINQTSRITLRSGGQTEVTGVSFTGDGTFGYLGKNGWIDSKVKYSPDTWYRFVVKWDSEADRADFTIYNEQGREIWGPEEVDFRSPVERIDRFYIHRVDKEMLMDSVVIRSLDEMEPDSLVADSTERTSNSSSLKWTLKLGMKGWHSIQYSYAQPQDWSAYQSFRFWVYGDGSGSTLRFTFEDEAGNSDYTDVKLSETGWTDFSGMLSPLKERISSGKTKLDLTKIKSVRFGYEVPPIGASGQTVIRIGEVNLYQLGRITLRSGLTEVGGVSLTGEGTFGYLGKNGWTDSNIRYLPNTWYRFVVKWDARAGKSDYAVYDERGKELLSANGVDFAARVGSIDRFYIHRVDKEMLLDSLFVRSLEEVRPDTIETDTSEKIGRQASLKWAIDNGLKGWHNIEHVFPRTQDWSDYESYEFWFFGDGTGRTLRFSFADVEGNSESLDVKLTSSGWTQSQGTLRPVKDKVRSGTSKIDLTRIKSVTFGYFVPADAQGRTVIRLAEIGANFEAADFHNAHQVDNQAYLDWVKSGGKLIVLNSHGAGFAADLASIVYSSETVRADSISGSEASIALPNINVALSASKAPSVEVIASYARQGKSVAPFAYRKEIGQGEIIYVDIRPFFSALEAPAPDSKNKPTIVTLGSIFRLIFPAYKEQEFPAELHLGYSIGDASLTGEIKATTKSFIPFYTEFTADRLEIAMENLTLENVRVKEIFIDSPSTSNVTAPRVTMSPKAVGVNQQMLTSVLGYQMMQFPEGLLWQLDLSGTTGRMVVEQGGKILQLDISNQVLAMAISSATNAFAYSPRIEVDGETNFSSILIEPAKGLVSRIGEPMTIRGKTVLEIAPSAQQALFISDLTTDGELDMPLPPRLNDPKLLMRGDWKLPWRELLLSWQTILILAAGLLLVSFFVWWKRPK